MGLRIGIPLLFWFLFMYKALAGRSTSSEFDRIPLTETTSRTPPPTSKSTMASSYPMTERLPKATFPPIHDVERVQTGSGYTRLGDHPVPGDTTPPRQGSGRPSSSRGSSFLREAIHFDSTNAPEQFRVAKGDVPDNSVRHLHRFTAVSETSKGH